MSVRRVAPAAVAAAAVLLTTALPGAVQTALDERQQYVATLVTGEVEALTGPVTRHCGIYTLTTGFDSPPAASRKEITTALRCVLDAQRRGRAAWAVWQVPGVDAIVFDGLAASAVSAVHLVRSLGSDAEVDLTPCLKPRVQKDASIVCANLDRPSGSGDVARALDRLGRDLEQTADVPRPAFADHVDGTTETMAIDDDGEAMLARAVANAQRAVREAGHALWPRCPRHFLHPLVHRDGWWFCDRDRAFVAELGRVSRVVPKVKRR